MHELSIALNLLDLAEEEAQRRGVAVKGIHLSIGPLSGVVPRALQSAFELACEGSNLPEIQLILHEVPLVVYCGHCAAERTLTEIDFCCPECGQPTGEIISGKELEITALEIES